MEMALQIFIPPAVLWKKRFVEDPTEKILTTPQTTVPDVRDSEHEHHDEMQANKE